MIGKALSLLRETDLNGEPVLRHTMKDSAEAVMELFYTGLT